MKAKFKLTALVAAAAMLLAAAGVARADERKTNRRGPSTTEKVIAGITVAAAVGLTAYALTRNHDRWHRHPYDRPHHYVAVSAGFRSYCVGHPRGPHYRFRPRGYWYQHNRMKFWRVPYVYNPRYDQAFNAGWERGYWAGYLQGRRDSRMRGPYLDRFHWNQRHMWGYKRGFGRHDSYLRGFQTAFRIGYRHGFRGYRYGAESFGFRNMRRHYR